MSRLIPIVVDDRERGGGVIEALKCSGVFDIREARLDIGDYRVDGRFVFERKTLPDFVASVISGRLFEQALRLTSQGNIHPVLILEGTASDLRNTRMSWEALQGALVTVSVFIGVPVLRARNAEKTVNSFLYVVRAGARNRGRRITAARLPSQGQSGLSELPAAGLAGCRAGACPTLVGTFRQCPCGDDGR